jgi:hypothetical protein
MNLPHPLDDVLADAEADGLLDDLDPLQSELWASDHLGAWWLAGADEATFGAEVLPALEKRSDGPAHLLARAVARVGATPGLRAAAGELADRLAASGVPGPKWADGPDVRLDACLRHADAFNDQESVVCVFSRAGEHEHALLVLVDHTLGGIAQDAFVVDDLPALMGNLEAENTENPMITTTPIDPADARALLARAFARTDEAGPENVGEDFPAARAFALSRVQLLPEGGRPVPEAAAYDPDALVADFLAAPEAGELPDPAWAGRLVRVWLDHLRATGDDPARVSPAIAEELLLDVTPGAVLLDAAGQRAVPAVARAWAGWAARGRGLPAEATAYLENVLGEVLDEFPAGYLDLEAVLFRHGGGDKVDLRPLTASDAAPRT